jgi:hypothetical protein
MLRVRATPGSPLNRAIFSKRFTRLLCERY